MLELQLFSNPEFGELQMIEINGKPYIAATDSARILGYANPDGAIRRHCKCPLKQRVPHPQSQSKTIEMNFIPEGDLYRLIVHSKLKSVEKFEKWVFDEVIPSVMRTGSYVYPQASPNELIAMLAQANLETGKRIDALEESQNRTEQKIEDTIDILLTLSPERWAKTMESKIKDMNVNYSRFLGKIFKEMDNTGMCLHNRMVRFRHRMRKGGSSYKESMDIGKLDIVSRDKDLRKMFEEILGEHEERYEMQEELEREEVEL